MRKDPALQVPNTTTRLAVIIGLQSALYVAMCSGEADEAGVLWKKVQAAKHDLSHHGGKASGLMDYIESIAQAALKEVEGG